MNNKITAIGIITIFIMMYLSGCVSNDDGDKNADDGDILKTFVVTEKGSQWTIDGGALEIDFPENATNGDLTVVVRRGTNEPSSDAYIPGTLYSFGPDGTQFDRLVNLSIHYDPNNLPVGANEENLTIGKLIDGKWHLINGSVDIDNHVVYAHIWSFSEYGTVCQDFFKHGGDWSFLEGPSDIDPFDFDDIIDPDDKINPDDEIDDLPGNETVHLDSLLFKHQFPCDNPAQCRADAGAWTSVSGDWYVFEYGDGYCKFKCNGTKHCDSIVHPGTYSDVDFLVSMDIYEGTSVKIIIRGQIVSGMWNSYYALTFDHTFGSYSLWFTKKIGNNTTTLWKDQGFVPDHDLTGDCYHKEHGEAFRVVMKGNQIYLYYTYFDTNEPEKNYEEYLWSGVDNDLASGKIGIMGCAMKSASYRIMWAELWT